MKQQLKGLTLAISACLLFIAPFAFGADKDIFADVLTVKDPFSKKAIGIYTVDKKCFDLNNAYHQIPRNGIPAPLDPNNIKESAVVIFPAIYHNHTGLAVVGLEFAFRLNNSPGKTDEFFYSQRHGLRAQQDKVTLREDFVLNDIVGETDAVTNRSSGFSTAGFSSPFFKKRQRYMVANKDGTFTLKLPMGWSETAPDNEEITCTLTRKADEPQDLLGMARRLSKVDNAARVYGNILQLSGESQKDPANETDPQKIAHIREVNRLLRALTPEPLRYNTTWEEINSSSSADQKEVLLRLKRMYGGPETENDPWAESSQPKAQ